MSFVPLSKTTNKSTIDKAQHYFNLFHSNVQLNKYIFKIQQTLFYQCVTEEHLRFASDYLLQEHYKEVIIERNVDNLCGYPLCPNEPLKLKGKYRISSKHQKVFDITELKSYCSSDCVLASKIFLNQLSNEPLRFRKWSGIISTNVKILPPGKISPAFLEKPITRFSQKLKPFKEEESLNSDIFSKHAFALLKELPGPPMDIQIHEKMYPLRKSKPFCTISGDANVVEGYQFSDFWDKYTKLKKCSPKINGCK